MTRNDEADKYFRGGVKREFAKTLWQKMAKESANRLGIDFPVTKRGGKVKVPSLGVGATLLAAVFGYWLPSAGLHVGALLGGGAGFLGGTWYANSMQARNVFFNQIEAFAYIFRHKTDGTHPDLTAETVNQALAYPPRNDGSSISGALPSPLRQ